MISTVNLLYTAGDASLAQWAGGARASNASQYTAAGFVTTVGANVRRDSHYLTCTDGLQRHLIQENVGTNAFLWSEDFTNVVWTPSNGVISADATIAPDSNATADGWIMNAGSFAGGVLQAVTMTASTAQAVSIFAKAGNKSWMYVQIGDLASVATDRTWINLSTGQVGTTVGTTVRNVAVWPFANNWYRIEIGYTTSQTGANSPAFQFRPADADANTACTGDGATINCYWWGAQFEKDRTWVSTYVPTTSAPATRALDGVLSLPHGLVPQARTMYANLTSVYFPVGGSSWWVVGANPDTHGLEFNNRGAISSCGAFTVNKNISIPIAGARDDTVIFRDRFDQRSSIDSTLQHIAGVARNGGVENINNDGIFAGSVGAPNGTTFGTSYGGPNYAIQGGFTSGHSVAIRQLAVIGDSVTMDRCRLAFTLGVGNNALMTCNTGAPNGLFPTPRAYIYLLAPQMSGLTYVDVPVSGCLQLRNRYTIYVWSEFAAGRLRPVDSGVWMGEATIRVPTPNLAAVVMTDAPLTAIPSLPSPAGDYVLCVTTTRDGDPML